MLIQIHQVIKADVTAASDLADACRAVDQKLQQLAEEVVKQQQALQVCKVVLHPFAVSRRLLDTLLWLKCSVMHGQAVLVNCQSYTRPGSKFVLQSQVRVELL